MRAMTGLLLTLDAWTDLKLRNKKLPRRSFSRFVVMATVHRDLEACPTGRIRRAIRRVKRLFASVPGGAELARAFERFL